VYMTRRHWIGGLIAATTVATLSGCILWSSLQSPERAKTDPWMVWISVLKGFSGDVYYVGTKEPYAYFRIDSLFSYLLQDACLQHFTRRLLATLRSLVSLTSVRESPSAHRLGSRQTCVAACQEWAVS
jgi:hypothetical protein